MPTWWPFPVFLAVILSALLTHLTLVCAEKIGIVDVPDDDRKRHAGATALLGGVPIFLAFAIVVFVLLWGTNTLTSGAITARHILGFLLGGLALLVVGVLDDKYALSPRITFLGPLVAALVAVLFGIGVAKITNPFGGFVVVGGAVSAIFTFAWLLSMSYTTKLMDGLDGLASTVTLVGAFMIAAVALSTKFFQPDAAILALVFAASIAGFLLWNWPRACIFLGEGGSTFLGYGLGVLAIIGGSKVATALLVVGVPALDVAIVILRRLRAHKNPFRSPDRLHLHHLLLDEGLPSTAVVCVYVLVSAAFGVTTLLFASWQKVIALCVLGIVGIFVLLFLLSRRKTL